MIPHPAMPAGWTTSSATVYPARYGPGVTRHRTVIGEVPVTDDLSAEIRVDREGDELAVALALVGGGTDEDVPALLRRLVGLGEHDDDARQAGGEEIEENNMEYDTEIGPAVQAIMDQIATLSYVDLCTVQVYLTRLILEHAEQTLEDALSAS